MKRSIVLLIVIAMVLALTSASYAASSRKGKKVFAKVCGSCHSRSGDAKKIKPSKKTMGQWKRFITKNKHKADPDVLNNMADKDKKNLQKFLLDYALDADVAETCG